MATLYITEYHDIPATKNGAALPAGQEPAVVNQSVPISGASAQSAPFSARTSYIMVNTDTTCSLAFGDDSVTANPAEHRMSANETRFYGVNSGDRLAVIVNT
jgi:hypothetical protein